MVGPKRDNIHATVGSITWKPRLTTRLFADNFAGLGFLQSVSYIKSIPTHDKIFAVGKSGPTATFNLNFLGLGWPCREFVGFMIVFIWFPTQQNLINRKHPNTAASSVGMYTRPHAVAQ